MTGNVLTAKLSWDYDRTSYDLLAVTDSIVDLRPFKCNIHAVSVLVRNAAINICPVSSKKPSHLTNTQYIEIPHNAWISKPVPPFWGL